MQLSQKCLYGLRAIFELARRGGEGPVRIADIAQAQAIPPRFLEGILNQLKKGGFVESWRGASGGYTLVRSPGELSIGEVIRFIEGPIRPVLCVVGGGEEKCPLLGSCVFLSVWQEAGKAMADVLDRTTFQDLVGRQVAQVTDVGMFSI